MSDPEVQRNLGALEEAVDTLKLEVTGLRGDVAEIKSLLSQAKGGYKTLIAVATCAGAVGAFVSHLLPWRP